MTGRGPLADVVGADLDVPLVTGGSARYANLDYAASTPALRAVADRVTRTAAAVLERAPGRGVRLRGLHQRATRPPARRSPRSPGRAPDDVVIFTRNTTDALNLLATAVPGPVVHLDIEHHANLLPWQARGARTGERAGGHGTRDPGGDPARRSAPSWRGRRPRCWPSPARPT